MTLKHIDNIEFNKVTDDILVIHQIKAPSLFSICDGLLILPKKGRNSKAIVLDANVEPKYIKAIIKAYGQVSDYVCSHAHMDHSAHVYSWEQFGATIHAFKPDANKLTDLKNLYYGYGFNEAMNFHTIKKFAKINGYHKCSHVKIYNPGATLKFENFKFKTIPFQGHSLGHVGFLLPKEKILHISCLGFDLPKPGSNGFGPWYGFKQCSIIQYLKDINTAESLFLSQAEFLTSSHSYIVKKPDLYPFNYMRKKINENQQKIDQALKSLNFPFKSEHEAIKELLKMDIFFPKKKMRGFMFKIYTFWEYWIIKNHILQK